MEYEIVIVADTNDADFVTNIGEITNEKLEIIKPLIEQIKISKFPHGHNYPWGEINGDLDVRSLYHEFNDEVFDLFEEYVPYGTHGIHTIESIEVYPTPKKEVLL